MLAVPQVKLCWFSNTFYIVQVERVPKQSQSRVVVRTLTDSDSEGEFHGRTEHTPKKKPKLNSETYSFAQKVAENSNIKI